ICLSFSMVYKNDKFFKYNLFEPYQCVYEGCKSDRQPNDIYCRNHRDISDNFWRRSRSKSNSSNSSSSSYNSSSNSYKSNSSSYYEPKVKYTNPYKSYDEGYEDVYYNGDYDWDRYYSDDEYASGVDDALEEVDY
ncbi:MAG: hypothetical protein IAC55_06460, partial [Tyzzerella sp.]|nr:hypothetical protein [Candidatus Fimicola merdigallinarum]